MKKTLSLLSMMVCFIICEAQIIENPSFERIDVPAFHITKVEITKDTTYVFCSYYGEAGNWASISKNTYLRDSKSLKSYPLQRCEGLPYSPEKRVFNKSGSYKFLFCFPSIVGIEEFDFIESEGEEAFNIYNVNLNKKFRTSYTDIELKQISEMMLTNDSVNKEKGTHLKDYATSLNILANYYASIGNFEEAIRFGAVELNIIEKIQGKEDSCYIEILNSLVDYNTVMGDYSEAIKLSTEAMEIYKKVSGIDNPYYATILNKLADLYSIDGKYSDAIKLGTEAMEIYKRVYGTDNSHYATTINNLAGYYQDLGDYSEAFRLTSEAKEIYERVFGKESLYCAISLNNYAAYYLEIGNYSEAIRLGIEAMELYKKNVGTEHHLYALSLSNLANYYSRVGNYLEAIRLVTEAIEIYKRVLGTVHPYYVAALNILAINNSEVGNYTEAIKVGTQAKEIIKRVHGTEHPDYARLLNGLAFYYSQKGDYSEAIKLGNDALDIRRKLFGIEHPNYATSLCNLAVYNSCLGDYDEAIRLGTEAMTIFKKSVGAEHPYFSSSLTLLAQYNTMDEKYLEAFNYLQHCLNNSQSYILKNFTELSSCNQEKMWNNNYAYKFNILLPYLVAKYKTEQTVSELYNKTCLFAKGILLNSGIEIRKLILESGDSIIIDRYNVLSSNINLYNKLLEKPIKERFINVDSLNRVIEQQEMELARESKTFGDYTHNLTISWKDVQSKLSDNDIAVEFLDFPIPKTDSILYMALTLKKDYDSPHMVKLFERNQLKVIPENVYYTQTDLSDIIWKPMEEELKNVRNIYFAPSGDLHKIGIEYLPINETEKVCDNFTLHRLSSTRQLAFIKDDFKGENSILYGGINYDEKTKSISTDSSYTKEPVYRNAFTYRANVDSLLLRNTFDYLEGTKKEADMIAKDLELHRVPYVYYSGTKGTEESFKKLDGTRPKVMHIATHGFYFTEEESGRLYFARHEMELAGLETGRIEEQKPMTRSGLLFSGCNRTIRHEIIPDDEEDGVLTAQEISSLDLRGLDLVVLSACQTGLGDIVSGEGVFGLQRGFKKAGAKTIIMSLWNVNDESTMMMMTSFYHHYLEGMSKEEAFHTAQDELKKNSQPQQERPDWAAFILLDGIN